MAGKRRAEPPGRRRGSEPGPAGPSASANPRPPGAGTAPPVVTPIKTRRQARIERRARRRRIGGAGIAAIVVVVALVAVGIGFGVHSITTGKTDTQPPQTTLLFELSSGSTANAPSVGGILFGHEAQNKVNPGVELLIQPNLITNVCGVGEQSFSQFLTLPGGAQQAADALSTSLLGVHIDGTWTLTGAQLAALVNAVGGVTVNVDVDVTKPGARGTSIVELQRGTQQLNGAQAAMFASYRTSPGEDASAGLARLQSVMQAAIDKLGSVAHAQAVLAGLHSASSLPPQRLAQLLVALAGDDKRDGGVLAYDLPTRKLPTLGSPSYNIDPAGAATFVRKNFAPSLPKRQATGVQVLLKNGIDTPGLIPSACRRLTAAGMRPQGSGNSGSGLQHTEILINARTVALAEQADQVARALRLPLGDVQVNPVPSTFDGVIVVLGADYKP